MPEVVTSTLLTLAGLLGLLGALAGALLWVDGKPVAAIPSKRIRWLMGVISLVLIVAGIWLDYHRSTEAQSPEVLVRRVAEIDRVVGKLQADNSDLDKRESRMESESKALGTEFSGLRSQTGQLTADARRVAVRAATSASDPAAPVCDGNAYANLQARLWVETPKTRCDMAINSVWTIEIVVSLPDSGRELEKNLATTGVSVYENPTASQGAGRSDELFGIVFPDSAPHQLICKIRDLALAPPMKLSFLSAMTAGTFRRLSGYASPSYAIQVGVPLAQYVEGGRPLKDEDWQNICGRDMKDESFDRFLEDRSREFKPKSNVR